MAQRQLLNQAYFSGEWDDEFGFNLFKTIRKAAKAVTSTAKAATPYVVGGAVAATAIFPPGAPVFAGAAAGVAAVGAADSQLPKVRQKARNLVKNTKAAALAGNAAAARAYASMQSVDAALQRSDAKGLRVAFVVDKSGMVMRIR